jgi:hypothetical protein
MNLSFNKFIFLLTFQSLIIQNLFAQSLNVTNPQMGWTWNYASSVTVEWNYSGFSGNVAIDIYKGSTNQIRIVSSVPVSQGRVDFVLPGWLQPGSDYKVGISATPSGDPWDFSDEFAIRKLQVTYPNGGQNLHPSDIVNVTWNYNTVTGDIAIDLYKGDTNIQRVISSTSVYDNNENITIPPSAPLGSDYKIAISGHGGYVYDFSDNFFMISEASTRIINLSGDMNFGSVQVGQTSQRTLTISNSGNSTLTVSSINYPSGFIGNWSSGSISAGSSQNVTVTFTPSQAINYSGNLTVYSDKTDGTNTKYMSGIGTSAPTRIINLSGDMNFGSIQVGQTSQRTLTISNSGNSALTVSSINYPTGFSGNWSSGSILASSSQNVTVSFAPSQATNYSGNLTVYSNKTDGTNIKYLSGTGTSAPTRIINVSGDMNFGSVQVGQISQRTLTISNSGNSTLTVSNINYPTSFSGNWSSGSVSAGGSQNITVTFAPSKAINYSGNLTVYSDKTDGTNIKYLSGTGTSVSTRIIRLEGNLNFGSVEIGNTRTRNLMICNDGNSILNILSINCSEGFSGKWSGNIPSYNSQNVTIIFTPTELKDYTGNLLVNSNKTSGDNVTQLFGTGISSFSEINLKVPFKAQTPPPLPYDWDNTLNCGQTCCAMIFSYYAGDTPTIEDIMSIDDWLYNNFGYPINNYCGSTTNTDDLVSISKGYASIEESSKNNSTNGSLNPLIIELQNYYPVIVAVRINMVNFITDYNGHFMVLRGIDDNYVYINDPGKSLGSGLGQNMKYSKEQFINSWSTQSYAYVTIHDNKLGGSSNMNIPQNLVYETDGKDVVLGWDSPYNEDFLCYNIYRNGTKIGSTEKGDNLYFDSNLQYNIEYSYCITANFSDGEGGSSNQVFLTLMPSTSVETLSMKPNKFELCQNYPNPFNPITTITYSITETQNVILNIFNTQGQLIELLVNDIQSQGIYKVDWDASGYVSGLYFIDLQTDTFCDVKKCLLLK